MGPLSLFRKREVAGEGRVRRSGGKGIQKPGVRVADKGIEPVSPAPRDSGRTQHGGHGQPGAGNQHGLLTNPGDASTGARVAVS